MSRRDSWPGEKPDPGEQEDLVEEAEDEVEEAYGDEDEPSEPERDGAARDEDEDEERDEDEDAERDDEEPPALRLAHVGGELAIPDDVDLLEGTADGTRRRVAIVAARFNGEVVNALLESALDELDRCGVSADAVTVMPVPGAFELPLAAMALAKTRRYACIVALGCVIRGETPHFEYVAGEAASGLQLAALETGVPVAFGVLTVESLEQAQARVHKGAEAVRSALELADAFAQLRATAQAAR